MIPSARKQWDWQATADYQAAHQRDRADTAAGCTGRSAKPMEVSLDLALQQLDHPAGYQIAPPARRTVTAQVALACHRQNSFYLNKNRIAIISEMK